MGSLWIVFFLIGAKERQRLPNPTSLLPVTMVTMLKMRKKKGATPVGRHGHRTSARAIRNSQASGWVIG
jgi:hypothetical protein